MPDRLHCRKGCSNTRKPDHAFCPSCWYALPRPLQARIWRLFIKDRGSEAHLAALKEAYEYFAREQVIPDAARQTS